IPHTEPVSRSIEDVDVPQFLIDHKLVRATSQLAIQAGWSLAKTIRVLRGQNAGSPSTNKALSSDHYAWRLHGYEYVDQIIASASRGVEHLFKRESETLRQREPSKSTYLVVSRAGASRWKLHYSPFGCEEKADVIPAIEASTIHDFSYPLGEVTNSWPDQESIPERVYQLVDVIARRIIRLRAANRQTAIKLMKSDVNSAFRNLHVHESASPVFAGSIPEQDIVMIDLALPLAGQNHQLTTEFLVEQFRFSCAEKALTA
ncbi:hypothetical protein F442_13506, partial [Phytophthora nicotianae P10297]